MQQEVFYKHPHFDKLASQGLLYNQFHTTALCSPTRQALKTGRNHHSANQAKISEVATSFPGATGMLPDDVAGIGTYSTTMDIVQQHLANGMKQRCGRSALPDQ